MASGGKRIEACLKVGDTHTKDINQNIVAIK
jgi:hypothetical protein